MDILKSASETAGVPDRPDTRRRSFMWKVGAVLPAGLASAVSALSRSRDDDQEPNDLADRLSRQLGIVEDEKAIGRLHRTYETALNAGRYEDVLELFTVDAEVVFNGGVFRKRSGGLRRLYCERFKSGRTGGRIEPAPGFQPDSTSQEDHIRVAPDRQSAGASFPFSIQVGMPILPDSPLVRMARLHGEGVRNWWEGGIYEISYVKATGGDGWKIRRLEYRVQSSADYRPGKSHAGPISVPVLSKAYPDDPTGPDSLTGRT